MKRVAVAAAALSAMATLAGGQPRRIVQGVVSDGSNRPVPMSAVLVVGIGSTITDDSGRFRLEITHNDRISLDVRHIGYMPSRFGLGPGGDPSLDVLILPRTTQLTTVDVTSSRVRPPSLAGFEERLTNRKRGAGVGQFITEADIAKLNASRSSQILETVPSIFVRRTAGNDNRYSIFGRSSGGGECAASVFLDGIRLGTNGELTVDRRGRYTGERDVGTPIDDYVAPVEIAGIEIYQRGLLAPPQFQSTFTKNQTCAVVVVWTKFS